MAKKPYKELEFNVMTLHEAQNLTKIAQKKEEIQEVIDRIGVAVKQQASKGYTFTEIRFPVHNTTNGKEDIRLIEEAAEAYRQKGFVVNVDNSSLYDNFRPIMEAVVGEKITTNFLETNNVIVEVCWGDKC